MPSYDDLRADLVSRGTDSLVEWFDAVTARLRSTGWTAEDIDDSIAYAPEWDDLARGTGWREWADDPAGCADWLSQEYDMWREPLEA